MPCAFGSPGKIIDALAARQKGETVSIGAAFEAEPEPEPEEEADGPAAAPAAEGAAPAAEPAEVS